MVKARNGQRSDLWKPVVLLIFIFAVPVLAATWSEDLFQKALFTESVERNLDGAASLYQQVIEEATDQPGLVAEARLRLGICLEKLGKPREAQISYQKLLASPTGANPDVLQKARSNLRRLEAESRVVKERVVVVHSPEGQDEWIKIFKPSPLALLVGPYMNLSHQGRPSIGLGPGLRYRLSPEQRPLAWFLEAQGRIPFVHSQVGTQSNVFDSQENDNATLSVNYEASVGLVGEIPHGQQKKVIPELGAGLGVTASRLSYSNSSSSGEVHKKIWTPYLEAGLHFFAERRVSVIFQTRYVIAPYPTSVDISPPDHSQTFNFPASVWTVGLTLQIKMGRTETVLKSSHE